MSYDVARLTMGRVGVDLYPLQAGLSLADVTTFGKFLGGSATNVAVAAARHGRRSAVITRTGDDPFGRFVHAELVRLGVSDEFVSSVPSLPTPITFCEIFPPDNFPLWFYRFPKAPDLEIKADELDLDAGRDARVFWATVTGLSQEPSRDAHHAAWTARGRQPLTVLDLDYRPMFWTSREAAHEQVTKALPNVTVAVGNLDEAETAVGESDPEQGGPGAAGPRGRAGDHQAGPSRRPGHDGEGDGHGAADAGQGPERARRGRRFRRRAVPRAAFWLAAHPDPALRERRRRDRRLTAGMLDRDADYGRSEALLQTLELEGM